MSEPIAREKYLSDEELSSLLRAAGGSVYYGARDHAMLSFLANTGVRPGECLAVTMKDLTLRERDSMVRIRRLKKRKLGGVIDDLPISRSLSRELRAYIAHRFSLAGPDARIFPMTVRNAELVFKRVAARAGLAPHFRLYCLRHTFGTRARRRLGDLRLVQELMGHASLETTQIYTHVSESERRRAAELVGAET